MDINDFSVELNYFIDNSMEPGEGPEKRVRFGEMEDYNYFESREECKLWARKINALHKLRLIDNHLNGDFSREEDGHAIRIGFFFADQEKKQKAIEMMGEKSMEDLFA